MEIAVVILAVAQPVGLFLLFRYLNERDAREAQDRQVWANRIQSPVTAVTQTLQPEVVDLGPPDTEWSEMATHAAMVDEFTEAA